MHSSKYKVFNADDNKKQIVFTLAYFYKLAVALIELNVLDLEEHIHKYTLKETKITFTLQTLHKNRLSFLAKEMPDWEEFDGLLYHKGRLYVSDNKKLRQEIMQSYYNTFTTEHFGKHSTLELVLCQY